MEGSPLHGPAWADFGRRRGPRSRRALSSLRAMTDPAALESASHADRGRLISGERWPCRSRTRVAASRVQASAVTAQLGRPEYLRLARRARLLSWASLGYMALEGAARAG